MRRGEPCYHPAPMVTVSIFYPHTPGGTFDMNYYLRTHMPMSLARLRSHPGFIALSVERGVVAPGSEMPPPYVAMCRYTFRTADDFVAAFSPHALELQSDIPKYTNITPVVQFSAVALTDRG
jgi:uncharacterized protein (TIGR02118 family)